MPRLSESCQLKPYAVKAQCTEPKARTLDTKPQTPNPNTPNSDKTCEGFWRFLEVRVQSFLTSNGGCCHSSGVPLALRPRSSATMSQPPLHPLPTVVPPPPGGIVPEASTALPHLLQPTATPDLQGHDAKPWLRRVYDREPQF
eukprot:s1822_g11.t2